MPSDGGSFSERDFYLAEFRGRTLGIAVPEAAADWAPLTEVLAALAGNDTRVVLLVSEAVSPTAIGVEILRPNTQDAWSGLLWRRLSNAGCVAVSLPERGFPAHCRDGVVRLQLAKLIWLDERGALRDAGGGRISVIARADLESEIDTLLAGGRGPAPPLREFSAMLAAGVGSVSLCRLRDLERELFTYAGSGTFFSRQRYTDVRRLGLDDFDSAAYLIAQGVAEGYLAPRSPDQVEALLGHGFGVFVEGRYLAGVGALLPYVSDGVGEIAGLYTVTRFEGEGVGGYLVRFAVDLARASGLRQVFACTTSERVEQFFLRQGFEPVTPDAIPAAKWQRYPEERRPHVRCVAHKVMAAASR